MSKKDGLASEKKQTTCTDPIEAENADQLCGYQSDGADNLKKKWMTGGRILLAYTCLRVWHLIIRNETRHGRAESVPDLSIGHPKNYRSKLYNKL